MLQNIVYIYTCLVRNHLPYHFLIQKPRCYFLFWYYTVVEKKLKKIELINELTNPAQIIKDERL